MKNIAFIGNSEPPSRLLEIFKKQTPNSSGVWGQLRGVNNYKDADYYMAIDEVPGNLNIDMSRCIILGTHPETSKCYRYTGNINCFKRTDINDTIGMLEWWINFDYDYLKALKPPTKSKTLGCIMSNANSDPAHVTRKNWLRRFTQKNDLDFNLHGRIIPSTPQMQRYYRGICGSYDPRGAAASGGNNHMIGKENVYLDHKYMLEFDTVGRAYFSERILDCMLLWAMPLYWGGNLHSYLPQNSYRYIDINGSGDDVLKITQSSFYEDHLNELAKAREILLDELQLWPRIHHIIFGTFK